MTFAVLLLLWGQVLAPMPAYTTADPVTDERLGLATPYGRYAIVLSPGCTIGELAQVHAWPLTDADGPSGFILAPDLDGAPSTNDLCLASVDAKMAATPCFGDGVCDVRYEYPE